MKETDLFEPMKEYLLENGYEVYSEVLAYTGARADIVAVKDNIVTVIELKTSLSLDLLEQAYRWTCFAHYIYICVPNPRTKPINSFAEKICRDHGIGLITVKDFGDILIRQKAKLHRNIINKWDKYLTEEHKNTLPGGSSGGGYITPYSRTMRRIKNYIAYRKEGVSLDDIAKYCPNHYIHPKQGIYQALTKFESEWCEMFKRDGKTYFRIKTA